MRLFKFFWQAHKWVGIVLAAWVILLSVTGFLLLIKKKVEWIQPSTQRDSEPAAVESFIDNQRLFEIVFAENHPDFQTLGDIDRIDFRPGKAVFKVRSTHHDTEIQVGAVTGKVLSTATRRSDLIERIHDGSFFADYVHEYLSPAVAICLAFLACSGLWIWLEPVLRRRRRRAQRQRESS